MGSGQSSVQDEAEQDLDQPRPAPNRTKPSTKKRANKDSERNKTLSNRYEGKFPGEEEDTYNGFFDDIEEVKLDDSAKSVLKDDVERVGLFEEELKKIIDEVDKEITVAEEDPAVENYAGNTTSSECANVDNASTEVNKEMHPKVNKIKPRHTIQEKNNNTDVPHDLDWTYKQESIEGFDLEKFQKANIKLKNIARKERKNVEYKVYSVDPYDIDTSSSSSDILGLANSRFGEKNKVPKYDFVDERLMSQIESEFS